MDTDLVSFLHGASGRFGQKTALLMKPSIRYRTWSYEDLWAETGKVASLLQQRGVAKGDRIAMWAPNSPQWVFAFFGAMRAGAIPVPIDMRSEPGFVARVVERSRPTMGFASRFTPGRGVDLGIDTVLLEDIESLTQRLPAPGDVPIDPDDVAEIMFTSGTTGTPKGVMLTHRNILADLEAVRHFIPGESRYRVVSLLPLSHMFEQMGGLFLAIACGADVTYITSMQPAAIQKTMRERRVVIMLVIPQVLSLFMKGIEAEVERQGKQRMWNAMLKLGARLPMSLRRKLFFQVHRKLGGALECFVAGGAALDPTVARKWTAMGVKVIQGYGATETAPVIATHPMDDPRYESAGRPLPGIDVRIAEDGEVLVRGANVFPGYWEAPEATAAVFEDGWYRTGDLGRFDEEGCLHLQGRKKDMIVLSTGQNVFPLDIENILNTHLGIADSAVVGLPANDGPQVHAAVVLREGGDAAAAVAWTNEQLAEHQRIKGFTVWPEDDLPRTHTLKVKKHEVLAALEQHSKPKAAAAVSASTEEVPALERIVAEVAGVAVGAVSDSTRLDDLGLDSLGRVTLLSAIEQELRIFIADDAVDERTTIEKLRSLIGSSSAPPPPMAFPAWGRRAWCRGVRGAVQRTMIFPALSWTYRVRASGLDHLAGLNGPVLIAANHHLHLDNGVFLKVLPNHIRRRLAIAASSHMFRNKARGALIQLLGNGFPFAKEGPVRPSLENLGRILDEGWSVMVYPEGELTVGGPMKPFKTGIGLVATEARVPVVPMRLDVKQFGWPSYVPALRRGRLEVRIGAPLRFTNGAAPEEAAAAIERAVAAL